jgi:hypothetical protein
MQSHGLEQNLKSHIFHLVVCIIILFFTLKQHIFLYKMLTFTFLWGVGGTLSGIFFESGHRVCLIELLLYDKFWTTRIKYNVYNVQDYRVSDCLVFFFYNIAVLPVYVRVAILLTSWKYLHDRIISLRWADWAYKSSLTLKLYIEVHVLSKESERSCMCVLDFGVVPTVWYFLFFIYFHLFISNQQQLIMKKFECIKC